MANNCDDDDDDDGCGCEVNAFVNSKMVQKRRMDDGRFIVFGWCYGVMPYKYICGGG